MKKHIIIIFTFITLSLYSQEIPKYLFINTTPIQASVIVNGTDEGLSTPVLLRDLRGVTLPNIVLKKEGYRDYILTSLDIQGNSADISMIPLSFELYFPTTNSYNIGGTNVDGPVLVSNMPEGTYSFFIDNHRMNINYSSSFIPAYAALGTASGIAASSMFAMLGLRSYYENLASDALNTGSTLNYGKYTEYKDGFQNAMIGTGVTAGVLVTALISVIIAEAVTKYQQSRNSVSTVTSANSPYNDQDKQFFDGAISLIGTGDIERSTRVLESILNLYPNTNYLPRVYYHLGQNYSLLGNTDNALKYLTEFINSYPLAEYYDFVIQNIAEIYYNKGDLESASIWINKVLYQSNQLNKENVDAFVALIDFDRYQKNKTPELLSIVENRYLQLISTYSSSDFIDIYFKQLIRLYNSSNNVEKINSLKSRLEQMDNISPPLKEMILSYF